MGRKILIADSNEAMREVLSEVFSEDYEVMEADAGKAALEAIRSSYKELSAAVLDLNLAEIDGFTILEAIQKQEWARDIPFIALSDDGSLKTEKRAYGSGAAYFSRKPFDSSLIKSRVDEIVDLYAARKAVKNIEAVAAVASDEEKQEDNIASVSYGAGEGGGNADKMFDALIEFVGRLVESRDPENQNHIYRIKGLVKIMAKKMQELYPEYHLSPRKIQMIVTACSIHDIGKIAIQDKVILKPGRLTDEEYEYMKSHTLRGLELLDNFKDSAWDKEFYEVAREIVRSHHEKYDGGGYPDGLKGDEIPISAQLVSIADTYDALVNDRVYRKAFSNEDAYNMINAGDSGIFPPKVLECFKACRADIEAWEDSTKSRGELTGLPRLPEE